MPRKPESRGTCAYCGEVFAKRGVTRHLDKCPKRLQALQSAAGSRQGEPTTKYPIVLLARNRMPEAVCQECGQPAKWLCIECLYEENGAGNLCDDHVEGHPHDSYGEPMPLYNSPRVGMCGYGGPAEPPY